MENRFTLFLFTSFGLLSMMVALVTMVTISYRKKQFNNKKMLKDLKEAFEKDLLKVQLEVQENTIQHLAREIHDNVGQKLTLAKLHLNSGAGKELSVELIGEALESLRNVSRTLSSEDVLQNGLTKALEHEFSRLSHAGIFTLSLSTIGDVVFMDSNKELFIFRIVQEAINNIIRHADANQITVRLHFLNDHLRLTIDDNGKGFDNLINTSNGLDNMRRRTKMLNGTISIQSEIQKGTFIELNIPYHDNQSNAG